MFQPVEANVNFPKLEEEILRFWREAGIYEKSLARRRDENAPRFVFYEGPPTANGKPHPGHCLTRAIKDLFPRYRTMRGYLCERKAGWDTHGLPVEVEVCKELGIHSKEEIENFGIEPFIQKCQQSVWRYMQEWQRMTERIGFWVDLDDAYVTYHQSYVESVWWSLKQLFDRGLLYQGHKIVWWWAQGGTALSSGEVGQGYREVADPSVYVKFPLVSDERTKELGLNGASLLVWTTTPWTLPSNQFAAVHPDLEYALVTVEPTSDINTEKNPLAPGSAGGPERQQREPARNPPAEPGASGAVAKLIIASALVETIAAKVKQELKIEKRLKGSALIGLRYVPPFNSYYRKFGNDRGTLMVGGTEYIAWRIVAAQFVTIESGSGLVHQAPAFGEVDFEILTCQRDRFKPSEVEYGTQGVNVSVTSLPIPELICAIASDGKFTDEGPDYCRGRWVKDCDKDIIHDLKNRGLLFHREEYRHEYPFCWRAEEDPLIQYPRRSWFIKTSEFKDRMLENNSHINWLPEHIKDGRFGNFLESNVDWALSRERFWGTPLPIWVCETTGKMEAVANYDELLQKPGVQGTEVWTAAKKANPQLADDLRVHKPYIDAVTYQSPFEQTARMKRVTEVIDCWYDSGAMPFAQWGYQGEDGRRKAEGGGQNQTSACGLAAQQFHEQFPADFISEALDQTRGWFYSQLAISTLLFSPEKAQGRPSLGFTHGYPHPFRNCIVLGLMLAEWWESKDGKHVFLTEEDAIAACGNAGFTQRVGKMSKQKRNYREPAEIFDKYGADALRWYFFANQPPWTSIRYAERAIKESIPEFLLRLWNVYSFFVIYANIDGFDPAAEVGGQWSVAGGQSGRRTACGLAASDLATAKSYRPIKTRAELDRWILGELNLTAKTVVERMDAYDNYGAAQRIIEFVDALSNWYVRRSRDRFWSEDKRDPDKLDAYWTLYECLLTTAKIIAPFVPFLAEAIWRNLAVAEFGDRVLESVHLADFPPGEEFEHIVPISRTVIVANAPTTLTGGVQDQKPDSGIVKVANPPTTLTAEASVIELSKRMNLVREIASLGLAARMGAKLKVRQPLAKVEVILADRSQQAFLEGHIELLKKELNVEQVEFTEQADHYITYTVLPDLKRLGPRLGKKLPLVKNALAKADATKLLAEMESAGKVSLALDDGSSESLDRDDLQVRLQAKPGWAAAQGKTCVVVLSTELSPELITEGLAREIVHAIQSARKDTCCEYTDRIEAGIVTESADIRRAVEQFSDYIRGETLAFSIVLGPLDGVAPIEINIGEDSLKLYVRIAKKK